jgi:hypothetical protein
MRLAIKIKEAHLPTGPGKTPTKDCTGTATKTLGIPSIHNIQPYVLAKNTTDKCSTNLEMKKKRKTTYPADSER